LGHAVRRLPAAVAVTLAVALSVVVTPGRASAGPSMVVLCWQQSYACTTGGYAGQPPSQWPNKQWASGLGYWNGASVDGNGGHHNCTLYAAYREALNGAPDPGILGNAADWAANAAAEGIGVDGTPAVGAIADWTGPNQAMGVGPDGHVAYVEVVTSQYIETTEDNFGNNDTGRRRIYFGSDAWPNAFIHLGGSPPPPVHLTDLFLYNRGSGASWTEMADGHGHWVGGVKGPQFASGWSVYPANLSGNGLTDLFLYNPASGASWTEMADGHGHWVDGVKGPQFASGWSVYLGRLR